MFKKTVVGTYAGSNQLYDTQIFISRWFHKNSIFIFHFVDGLNMAPRAKLYGFRSYFRCSAWLVVLKKTDLSTIEGSNTLYDLVRSFSESFKKTAFLFFTLQMTWTWPRWAVFFTPVRGHVEAICKVKNKNADFLKLSGYDVQSLYNRLEPTDVTTSVFFNTDRCQEHRQKWSKWSKMTNFAMLRSSAKWKWKMQLFWNFQEMIYRVCRID